MFQITIQSPFERNPVLYPDCNAARALELYEKIDWAGLWRIIEDSGSSQESDFYYYELKQHNHLGEEECLCISGYIGPTVCVGYFRPKTVTKRSFFKTKEVLEPQFQTQMDDIAPEFGRLCLEAFISGNRAYLEQNMYDKEVL